MKPTRNQLLAACLFSRHLTDREYDPVLWWQTLYSNDLAPRKMSLLATEILNDLEASSQVLIYSKLMGYDQLCFHVRIETVNATRLDPKVWKSLAVPIEPFHYPDDVISALLWSTNEKRDCVLQPFPGEMNLLCQALASDVIVDRYNLAPNPNYLKKPDAPEHIRVLDHGSVLLAFELAGISCPTEYSKWRKPDGDKIPDRATIANDETIYNIHYTDGELVLATSTNGMTAKVFHARRLKNASISELKDFTASAKASTERRQQEAVTIGKEEAMNLAMKFMKQVTPKGGE